MASARNWTRIWPLVSTQRAAQPNLLATLQD